MKPGRNPWSFFMQKNNENLGKTLTYGAPYVIIYTEGGEKQMSKKKKKRKLKEAVLVFSIIQSVVTTICMIYEAFFK